MSNTAILGDAILGDMILGEVGSDEETVTPPSGHGHRKKKQDDEVYEGLRFA